MWEDWKYLLKEKELITPPDLCFHLSPIENSNVIMYLSEDEKMSMSLY